MCGCSRRPEEGVRFLGVGVTGCVSHLAWVLGTELESSGRIACNFKKSFLLFFEITITLFCASFSSLKTLAQNPHCSLSNSWPFFSLSLHTYVARSVPCSLYGCFQDYLVLENQLCTFPWGMLFLLFSAFLSCM